ncbi:MAG: hypothetical protein LC750_00585 [Actinobacteria bacterium]|nr:hypothetical protein [Actinomycetota bacterium]
MDDLRLKPAQRPRAPAWKLGDDYDVICEGKKVGRIRHYNRSGEEANPWFWGIDAPGLKPVHGEVRTLDEAKAAFRRAWQAAEPSATMRPD